MAYDKWELLTQVTDQVPMGILIVDGQEKISLINQKGKEIIGIVSDKNYAHQSGKLEKGDMVLIADTAIGGDDGDLEPCDLAVLGIENEDLRKGDFFTGMGIYQGEGRFASYKHFRSGGMLNKVSVQGQFLGRSLMIQGDLRDKVLTIFVDGEAYALSYVSTMGHMVVLDKDDGHVKFVQDKGYTLRKEDIKNLLHGGSFAEKKDREETVRIIGENVTDILGHGGIAEDIKQIIRGEIEEIHQKVVSIHKRITQASITLLSSPKYTPSALVIFHDVSEAPTLLEERKALIQEIHRANTVSDLQLRGGLEEGFGNFMGNSPQMSEVKYLACKAAKNRSTVLLTGDSGTGKTLLAREIHRLYKESGPFVEVNCSSILHNLFESELFGYVGGAFTGALASGKEGHFEKARGGTIFLDEIAEIPIEIQAKLLQVLQDKIFYRVGSAKSTAIDVRIIAATNRNLEEEIAAGRFRQDLYYRLSVFPIHIPPLRSRQDDLNSLIQFFLTRTCQEQGQSLKKFSSEAMESLLHYSWPGNVRELQNAIQRAVVLCDTQNIYPEHLNMGSEKRPLPRTMKQLLEIEERKILQNAMELYKNKAKVMEVLDMSKSSLYDKLLKYQIKD